MPSDSVYDLLELFLEQREGPSAVEFDTWVERYPEMTLDLRSAWEDWQRASNELEAGSRSATGRRIAPGDRIGEFTIVRKLGEGGQAVVFEAEQAGLDRRVALKVLRPERCSESDLARFEREARAGARLAHEGIVAVHDFGRDGELSWIAQELVRGGRSVRDFIDEVRRSESTPSTWYPDVADLVRRIARALHVAHRAGIVHRDVKPQNILLTDDGVPKVGDFGLARVEETSALSVTGQLVGTYLYMSPEQVAARRTEIDHRTDVFSLGVVLYELLTLTRPFEGDTAHQVCSRIVQRDPPEPRQLRSQLPRDLSVICCKAIEKDRDRRYADMEAFADDLDRFLGHRPIVAKPPTRLARVAKWARRNPTKSIAGAVAAVAFVVISWLGWSLSQSNTAKDVANRELTQANDALLANAKEIEAQNARIEAERDRLSEVVNFQAQLFRELDPAAFGSQLRSGLSESAGPEAKAFDGMNITNVGVVALERFLVLAGQRVTGDFGDDRLTQARLGQAVADALAGLGRFESALPLRELVLEIHRELGDKSPELYMAANELAYGLQATGQHEQALALYEEAYSGLLDSAGAEDERTMVAFNNIGYLLTDLGRLQEARQIFEESLERRMQLLGETNAFTLNALNNLAAMHERMGEYSEAIDLYERSIDGFRSTLGDRHRKTLLTLGNLGNTYRLVGQPERARELLTESLDGCREVLGDNHSMTLRTLFQLSQLDWGLGNAEDAIRLGREAITRRQQVFGSIHPETISSVRTFGMMLLQSNREDEALHLLTYSLEESRRLRGSADIATGGLAQSLGNTLQDAGRYDESIPYFEESVAIFREVAGARGFDTLGALNNLAVALKKNGELNRAEACYREVLAGARELLGDRNPNTLTCMQNLGLVLLAQERLDKARPYLEEAFEGFRAQLGDQDPKTLGSLNAVGSLYRDTGDLTRAESIFRNVLEGRRRVLRPNHPDLFESCNTMGMLLFRLQKYDECIPFLEEALTGWQEIFGEKHLKTLTYKSQLADAHQQLGHATEAEALYLEALAGFDETDRRTHRDALLCLNRLGFLYLNQDDPARALGYFTEAIEGYRSSAELGPRHPETLAGQTNLAHTLIELDRAPEALDLLVPALETAQSELPPEDDTRVGLKDALEACCTSLKEKGLELPLRTKAELLLSLEK